MFRQLSDFFETWQYEREATEKIFSALRSDVFTKKENENIRTLGRLAGHIVESVTELGSHLEIGIEYDDQVLKYDNVEILLVAYRTACNALEIQLKSKWNDAQLDEPVNMYGEVWKKGKALSVLIAHQAHHRAQMTVLMRLVGLKVPGVYGPSKEEWAAFGMPAME
ncbi:MAG TPA: hypothetical protein DCQ28_03315 [Bacteroidetes bacterium]|nr:hypothetical protein [Bacteroidota bacterium]